MKHLGVAALFAFASTVWATELTVLNCNSGSAVIVRENTHPETLTARILSKEVVDSFVNAADTVSEIRDAAGNVYHIKKAFPPGMAVVDGDQGRFLEIHNITLADGRFTSGNPVGATFEPYQNGFDFVAVGGQMMPSRSQAIWFINRWWFDTCTRN